MSQTETHNGSIDGQEQDEVQKKVKSRRPASTTTTPITFPALHTTCSMADWNLADIQIPPSVSND